MLSRLAAVLAFLPAALCPAAPPASAPGTLTGRVSNAATGAFLQRARVAVRGDGFLAFTDDAGAYRLTGLPAGPVTVEVFYTGLDPQAATVTIPAAGTAERDFALTSAARYGAGDGTVRLDPFRVATARETDVEAIAINEQRFAPNLKSVVSTETLGDPLGGSVGDFLRFLPGVAAAYGALETEGVLIRGFPSGMTIVSSDGMQLAGANAAGERDFSPSRVAVNGIARVEVTKVPLPSTPADTMSGSINLVSKSAFERSRAELRFRAGLSSSQQAFSLRRTPAPDNRRTFKLLPDLSLDHTLPLSRDLGLVITALHSVTSFETETWYTDYRASATGTAATPANPYLWRHRNVEVSRDYERDSLAVKADWRPHRHGVLSLGATVTYYDHNNANSQFNPTLGNVGTPAVTGGRSLAYTAEEVLGATGRGSVAQAFSFSRNGGLNLGGDLRYRYDDGLWRVQAAASRSHSKAWRRDTARGFFNSLTVGLAAPVRLNYRGIRGGNISDFEVFDNADRPVDAFDLRNYTLTGASGVANTDIRATIAGGSLDVRRQLGFLAFPAALQVGGLWREQTNDDQRVNGRAYTYNGINGDRSAAPFLADVYYGARQFAVFAHRPPVPWVSPHKVWQAFAANPALFSQTLAQERSTLSNNILQSKYIAETVSAGYLQAEARSPLNRLSAFAGVRFERTSDLGLGPLQDPDAVFVRNANGSFARTPAGARIRKPEAGAAGSLAEVPLIFRERAARAERSYHGLYPSVHLNFQATERFLLRAAYARTYGRPNFSNIIPNTTVNQDDDLNADPDATRGRIAVSNISLKPWTADNFDLSAEYYTDQGGLFSGGVFLKEVRDFFGNYVKDATAEDLVRLGLDARYLGWRVTTKFNSGAARVRGAEINLRHSLQPLGAWGRGVIAFVNATKLRLEGDALADFTGFLPESVNWGVTIAWRRATVIAKWNYRGEQKAVSYPDMGPDAFRFPQARVQLDLSLDLRLTARVSLYANVRNVSDGLQNEFAYGSQTPAHAREFYHGRFGRPFTLGMRGTY